MSVEIPPRGEPNPRGRPPLVSQDLICRVVGSFLVEAQRLPTKTELADILGVSERTALRHWQKNLGLRSFAASHKENGDVHEQD